MSGHDAVIVGAGVMGCASAFALARRGVRVMVLERSVPGAEASSAAAGVLGAQVESHAPGAFTSLCLASRERFGAWADALKDATGIDVEHRACGITKVALTQGDARAVEEHASWQREAGLRVELVKDARLRTLEPTLAPSAIMGAHFPDDGRVDPPRFLRALRIASERAGATFKTGALVRRVVAEDGRARGVTVDAGETIEADHVVLAAGSWSTFVSGTSLDPDTVRPARGQIVELQLPVPSLQGVVWGERAYLSPRDDGRVLVGSTLEFVGFRRGVTAGALRDLIAAATELVPSLAGADFSRAWSSFRPYTVGGLPFIGKTPIERLWLATGHFRNGILLSPITSDVVTSLILGETPPVDPTPFAAGS